MIKSALLSQHSQQNLGYRNVVLLRMSTIVLSLLSLIFFRFLFLRSQYNSFAHTPLSECLEQANIFQINTLLD